MSNKKLIFVLLTVIVPTLLLIVYLILSVDNPTLFPIDNKDIKDTVRFEILKYLLQLFIVLIIGGMVAYFFKSREKGQEKERTRNEIRVNYFNRLGAIYRDVKSIRRTLAAEGLSGKYGASPSIITKQQKDLYSEQMKLLNHSQLLLECLKVESSSIPAIIKFENVGTLLCQMEDYLRQILREYEAMKTVTDMNYSNLVKLDEFTNSGRYGFKENFAKSYQVIIETIGKSLT